MVGGKEIKAVPKKTFYGPFSLRQAMGIMLVYDITNPKSFNSVTNWLRNIDEHASEDVVRVLLGNKVATVGSNDTIDNSHRRCCF